jgi:integrase
MSKQKITFPFFEDTPDQDQCRGTVLVVLNGDSSLYEPIAEVLTNAGFEIAQVKDQWFHHLWKIQRLIDASQTRNLAAPPPGSKRTSVSLMRLVEMFKAQWNHLAPATRTKFDCHFKVAKRYLDFDRDVAGIRLADMRELKSKLAEERKPSTINDIIFKALAALFTLALEDGIIDRSPLERLKRAKRGEIRREQPTWGQSRRIVDEVAKSTSETGLIVGFMRNFGVGQAEIKYLLGEHIDLTAQTIHFRRKKTGKLFDVPIFTHAQKFIETLKSEGRLQRGHFVVRWRNPRKALETACEHLNLPEYEPRALRRCFIVHCLETGIDPRVVAKWQGHSDAKLIFTTYGKHIDAKHEQREAANRVFG